MRLFCGNSIPYAATPPSPRNSRCGWPSASRQENLRFAELIRCDGGVLAPASETELERMRDNALREILTEEQLLQYYRYEALPAAYAAGAKPRRSFRSSSNSPIWS